MSDAIVKWLGGHDTGSSSKVIALTALGQMPADAAHSYPRDGSDFGRCYRLIEAAPEAKAALSKLAQGGGAYWAALVPRWADVEAAYKRDLVLPRGERGETYGLIGSIVDPIAMKDARVVRFGPGASMVLPERLVRR